MNTWFKNPEIRKYTWRAPGDCNRYQLDYTIVSEQYKNSVKDAHAYPGADIDSDHNLVMMKIRLRMKRPRQGKKRLCGRESYSKITKWNLISMMQS